MAFSSSSSTSPLPVLGLRSHRGRPFVLLALACLVPALCAQAADVVRLTVPASDANAVFTTSRIPADGLVLTLRTVQTNTPLATVSLKLHTSRPSVTVSPRDAAGNDMVDRAVVCPYDGRNVVAANSVTLRRRARGWSVYIDDSLSASFPDHLAGPVEVLHDAALVPPPPAAGSPIAEGDGGDGARVQRVAPFRFTDDFLIDEADAEGRKLNHWDMRAGTWSVHSVEDDMSDNPAGPERRAQPPPNRPRKRGPSAEHSPNFYCVEGSGTNALMLAGYDFYDRYIVSVSVHAGNGENGLAFLAQPGGAFHAFTATPRPDGEGLRFTLWRTATGSMEDRAVLAQYDTDLRPGQWHRLVVKLHDERIALSVNAIQLESLALPLPPGGRFGLFAHGPDTTRFDDVAAASHEDLEFPSVAAFRGMLLHHSGSIERRRGPLPVALTQNDGTNPPDEHLALTRPAKTPAVAIFGTPRDAAHVLATAVRGEGRTFEAALLAGWQSPDSATLRFAVQQTPTNRQFRIEWTDGAQRATGVVTRLTLPLPPSREPLQLLLDATGKEGVRAYADGRMVLVAPEIRSLGGAAGLAVLSSERLEFALPVYRDERREFRSKVEKTAAFCTDAYMRYWASPEGEWISYPDGKTWFKGDLFGAVAVHLPWKQPSTLHVAVTEDADVGPYQIVAADNQLQLVATATAPDAKPEILAAIPVGELGWQPRDAEGTRSNQCFSVHLEDHALWVRSGPRTLFVQPLPERLPGRRMRVEGLDIEQLGLSRVERTGIADFLFTESLHEWTLNGGRWEVVNRFQCDPRWSHLNGQNADSLAALWSRYEFGGDFCAELYAGMRHGWYDRPGDLNLTVLGAEESTASGYTFTCTGWDVDESQLYSRLFRNGDLLASSEKYLVPRVREGSVRRGYNPLIGGGRDVHGAWYYTQLRRVGDELQLSFDHEPVLTVRDPSPPKSGGLGIWTYRNSMVVARVKLAAENIRPRRFAVQKVDPKAPPAAPSPVAPWPAECATAIADVAKAAGVEPAALAPSALNPRYPSLPSGLTPPATTNGIPLAPWTPDTWAAHDIVSNARLDWRPTREAPDTFVMTARQAGGSFDATNTLPVVPLRLLAGWCFETARTADAQYNFHYTVGRMNNGAFEPAQSFFHVLSGTEETRGPVLRSGTTPIPATGSGNDPTVGPWTEVSVWLPAFPREEETLWVRVDGFGNLNASDVQQGLHGNRPGAAYAVRKFAPILLGAPVLADQGVGEPERKAFAAAVASRHAVEVHSLPLPSTGVPQASVVHWVLPPDNLGLTATWSTEWHDAVDIQSAISWPVRQLKGLSAKVNGHDATVVPREGNRLLVLLPRDLPPTNTPLYQIDLATSARRPVGWGLPVAGRPPAGSPVLLALESEAFVFENYERTAPKSLGGSSTLRMLDPQQGRFLRTANAGNPQRLATSLAGQTDLARNPVVQFRTRGDGMARVSLRVERLGDVAVSETPPHAGARAVRGDNPGVGDRWQTWTGLVTDNAAERPLDDTSLLVAGRLLLQSCANQDQTGRYSTLAVDDVVAGPAVGPNRPLRITPQLLDLDRDGLVEWTVLPGWVPYGDGTNSSAVAWQRVAGGAPVDVPFDGLPDGVHHVLFRPASPRGPGPVADVPFLLDRVAPTATHALESVPDFGNGTRLNLRIATHGGSQPQLQTLKMRCGDTDVDFTGGDSRISLEPETTLARLNWPRLLRKQIQRAADGDTLQLRIEGLVDGAGNASEAIDVPLPIRFADDKMPPTLQDAALPSNVAWMTAWHEPIYGASFRTLNQAGHRVVPAKGDAPAILQIDIGGGAASATEQFQRTPWNPERYPLLAMRVGFAKRPPNTSGGTLRLTLVTRDGPAKPTNLFVDAKELPAEITGKVDWSEGGISELVINARDLMRRLSGKGEAPEVVGLRFEFENAAGAQFQIHQAVIFSPWGANDTLKLRAYDASGIGGVTWQGDGRSDKLELAPATLTLPADDAAWLRLRLRDRAGNVAPLIHLPARRVDP